VAIVFLDRKKAMGNVPRVRTWESLARAAGATDVVLVGVPQARLPLPDPRTFWHLLRADAVVESSVRSTGELRRRVAAADADVVVFVTARVFDPVVAGRARHAVVDLVDELSANYRMRATRDSTLARRVAFRLLELPMHRFERKRRAMPRTAAGHLDAERMGARWVPNLVAGDAPVRVVAEDACDLLFVGSLGYEPNIEALRWFEPVWARLRESRPEARMLVAGANPAPAMLAWLQAVPGWEVVANFGSLDEVVTRGRVAVVPIQSATGFPNKVLEAAERGVPQVVSRRVTAGLGPDYPGSVADSEQDWLDTVARLLDDPARADEEADRVRRHVLDRYAPAGYVDVLRGGAYDAS
jgi:hypothetical protein